MVKFTDAAGKIVYLDEHKVVSVVEQDANTTIVMLQDGTQIVIPLSWRRVQDKLL